MSVPAVEANEKFAMFNVRTKIRRLRVAASLSVVVAALAGCVSPQPAPSSADLEISTVSPEEVRRTQATGSVVRWGGTIAGITNEADGKTVVEIVSRSLYSGGRPVHNDRSAGRFIGEFSNFLDPEIIRAGRDITLVGTVSGIRDGKIGDANYRFPVVAVDTYRYWKPRPVQPPRHFPHWNEFGGHRHSHDPFWDDWPFRTHRYPRRYRSGVSGSVTFILR